MFVTPDRPAKQLVPDRLHADAQRRDQAHARDDDSIHALAPSAPPRPRAGALPKNIGMSALFRSKNVAAQYGDAIRISWRMSRIAGPEAQKCVLCFRINSVPN